MEELRYNAAEMLEGLLLALLDQNHDIPEPSTIVGEEGKDFIDVPVALDIAVPILIKKIRLAQNLTQGDVARYMGVTYQIVQKLERPGANPSIKTLKKVFRALRKEPVIELI